MESFVYRFRSTDALLDGFHELEKQEIYFASPRELNDPLEGFKDLFWRGDVIAWSNLLRHYLLCLMQAVLRTLEDETGYEVTPETLPVGMTDEDLHPEVRTVFEAICRRFFEDAELGALPALLAERSSPVRRNELLSLFWLIHFRALTVVYTVLSPEQPIHTMDASLRAQPQRPLRLKESFAACEAVARKAGDKSDVVEAMSTSSVFTISQANFILAYNAANQPEGAAWKVISSTFPEVYVNGLERLLHYDWYTACFVAEPSHAGMWGYYGDGHRGACLKFKTSALKTGRQGVTLRCMVGVRGSAKSGCDSAVYDFRALELHEVQYADRYIEIDFFRALGTLTHRQLAFWFIGPGGAISITGLDLLKESESWREQYWEGFHKTVTTKLKDWQHEREYRITLHSMIADLSRPEARKLQYRFEDLQGIIFGIKTSTQDKFAIIRLLQQKCKETARKDFEIHQAYYSPRNGRMVTVPWNLVKLG